MKLKLDMNELTLADMEDFEAAVGRPFLAAVGSLGGGDDPAAAMANLDTKTTIGIIWVLRRSSGEDGLSFDDVRKMTLAQLQSIEVEVVGPEDPPPATSA